MLARTGRYPTRDVEGTTMNSTQEYAHGTGILPGGDGRFSPALPS
jgi:hypothetical protein